MAILNNMITRKISIMLCLFLFSFVAHAHQKLNPAVENKVAKVAEPLTAPINDPIIYLPAVLQNKIQGPDDQSSLKYNMIVMEILDAAKRSAATAKRVVL